MSRLQNLNKMSHNNIWNFEGSSESLLKSCIDIALQQNNCNEKFIAKFGQRIAKLDVTAAPTSPIVIDDDDEIYVPAAPSKINNCIEMAGKNIQGTENITRTATIENPIDQHSNKKNETITDDEFFVAVEKHFCIDFIVTECSKNHDLISKMPARLSSGTVQKLFIHLFNNTDNIDDNFLNLMFCVFLPMYVKKNSRVCIDWIVKTSETYPVIFQKLIEILLNDHESGVLLNYVNSIKDANVFMNVVTSIELSSESFVHNISAIEKAYSKYTNNNKTNNVQNYIKTNLLKHALHCTTNKVYGKLFKLYLENELSMGHTFNIDELQNCIQMHETPFSKSCMVLLSKLKENENMDQM